jgi:hypothetical protein
MLNSILVRARAHHADVLRQAGSCPSDPAKRQKMKQACRAVGTDCTTHPVSVCTLSLRSSGHFCSCTTVSFVRHHPCRLALQHKRGQVPQIHSAAHCAAVRGPTHPARRAMNNRPRWSIHRTPSTLRCDRCHNTPRVIVSGVHAYRRTGEKAVRLQSDARSTHAGTRMPYTPPWHGAHPRTLHR